MILPVHIGDGISEGTQVDLVSQDVIEQSKEPDVSHLPVVKGLDCDERTVIFNHTVRSCLFTMFSGAKKQAKTFAVPSKPKVLDSIHLKATVKKKITTTDAIAITDVLE